MSNSEEAQRIQLQINTIEALSKAFSDGKAEIRYDEQRQACVITKEVFDADGQSEIKTFYMTPQVIHEFVDLCDKQMKDSQKAFNAAKIAKGHAQSLYARAKELEQATIPAQLS